MDELQLDAFVARAEEGSLAREVASGPTEELRQPLPARLVRLGYLYELQGIEAYRQGTAEPDALVAARQHFTRAFASWRAVANLDTYGGAGQQGVSPQGVALVAEEIGGEPVSPQL